MIQFENFLKYDYFDMTSENITFNVGSNSNRLLLVGMYLTDKTTDTVSSLTFNSVSLTKIHQVVVGGVDTLVVYGLLNPASGENSINLSFGEATTVNLRAVAYSGVKQTNFPNAYGDNQGSAVSSLTVDVTTTVNYCWAVMIAKSSGGGSITPGSGFHSVTVENQASTMIGDSDGYLFPDDTHSMSFTSATPGLLSGIIVAFEPDEEPVTSSTTTSTTTSTTSAPLSTPGALAFGEETPVEGELPVSWATWVDENGDAVTVTGDSDWGSLSLDLDEQGRSRVYNLGVGYKMFTLTRNVYGTGSELGTLEIRGSEHYFTRTSATIEWEEYTGQINRDWKFVQVRVVYSS